MAKTVLIVDDEIDIQSSLSFALKDEGYQVFTSSSPAEAQKLLEEKAIDVTLYDVWFPVGDGIELLEWTRAKHSRVVPIMMSGHGNIELAIKAIRLGAYDFLEKPLELDKVLVVLKNALETKSLKEENQRLSRQVLKQSHLIGQSPAVLKLKDEVHKAALAESPVLIRGENGAGKELCARLLHQISPRREKSYVVMNCAAFEAGEVDEVLFGAEASSGNPRKIGRLEDASGGSIMLDELSSLPASSQARLVEAMQEGVFRRNGGNSPVELSARLIGGVTKDDDELLQKEKFSEDLFYRLGVVKLEVPPLRQRIQDIEDLAKHFLGLASREYGREAPVLSPELIEWMQSYEWPGNVRELKNVVERMLILNPKQVKFGVSDLPEELQGVRSSAENDSERLEGISDPGGPLRNLRAEFEKIILRNRLGQNNGNVTKTAESLGLERAHLHRKLKQYDIQANRGEDV